MENQKNAASHLWFALGDLAEWFARLGGSACYRGFRDEEIPIAILILLQSRFPSAAPLDAFLNFLSPQFWVACSPIEANIRKRINSIEAKNEEDIKCVILDFTRYVNTKLKQEEIRHWPAVLAVLNIPCSL